MTAMPPLEAASERKLRILHVLRAPLGGLFRHVIDLTYEQIARGHSVGLVVDSTTGGMRAAEILSRIEPLLALGVLRLPIRRQPRFDDISNAVRIALHSRRLGADIVHGHGSKGGAYARFGAFLPGFGQAVRAYTPHGGSFNYRSHPVIDAGLMAVERLLVRNTDVFLFESAFIRQLFHERVGPTRKLIRTVLNGLSPSEFVPVIPDLDAAEFLYVGELRAVKGIDTLIDAIALLRSRDQSPHASPPRLVLVGTGPEKQKLAAYAESCNVQDLVTFAGALQAREAFRLGRVLVVPSRAESLPYIVLEAAAAQVPMIATDVGGIGEIFGPYRDRLIPCGDPEILAARLAQTLAQTAAQLQNDAAKLASFVAIRFTIAAMADAVLAGYTEALGRKPSDRGVPTHSFALPSR